MRLSFLRTIGTVREWDLICIYRVSAAVIDSWRIFTKQSEKNEVIFERGRPQRKSRRVVGEEVERVVR